MSIGKEKIGVFFGGRSTEHDISIITGQLIIAGLKGLGYEVVPVYMTKSGPWLIGDEFGSISTFTGGEVDAALATAYSIDLSQSVGRIVLRRQGWRSKTVVID